MPMRDNFSVLNILTALCSGRLSRSEINFLIELSQSYAFSYLKFRYKNHSQVLLSEDLTLKELSIDAIAPLFERDDKGVFIKISKAFCDWEPRIESEERAVFFLNRLIAKSVEKYVAGILRQSDPFFSKILDSVNYLIGKENLVKKHILGMTYIICEGDNAKTGPLPDTGFILDLPADLFRDNKRMLSEILKYIGKYSDKVPAIPLNALVLKIKQIRYAEHPVSGVTANGNLTEVNSLLKKALDLTIAKMEGTYLEKNKINETEAMKIKNALTNVLKDMVNGGTAPGLHKYFLEQFPGLTFEDYEKRYQNIFEYLFKVMKSKIIEQIRD